MKVYALCLLLVAGAPVVSVAQTPDQQIAALLDLTGVSREISQIPGYIREEVSDPELNIPPVQKEKLIRVMTQGYDTKWILESLRKTVSQRYDGRHAAELRRLLEAPVAIKIRTLENRVSEASANPEIEKYLKTLDTVPPEDRRMELISAYSDATRTMELAFEMVMGVMRGFLVLESWAAPGEDQMSDDEIDVSLAMIQPEMYEELQSTFMMVALFAFRDLPDRELAEYNRIWESEAGQWFTGALVDAMQSAMKECVQRARSLTGK